MPKKENGRAVQSMNKEPPRGEPMKRELGVIRATDSVGNRFTVGLLSFERFDAQNYQFTISPQWHIIDALPGNVFRGLPGLDLAGRLPSYRRSNTIPLFIAERVPGPCRPDLAELFSADTPDADTAFAWLLKTEGRLGGDNLIMEPASESRCVQYTGPADIRSVKLTPFDTVLLPDLQDVASSNVDFRRSMMYILASGAQLKPAAGDKQFTDEERCTMLRLLLLQEGLDKSYRHRQRREGIDAAKEAGKYTGRKRIPVDTDLLEQIASSHAQGKMSTADAMKSLGIPSRSTFYRRLREVRGG